MHALCDVKMEIQLGGLIGDVEFWAVGQWAARVFREAGMILPALSVKMQVNAKFIGPFSSTCR